MLNVFSYITGTCITAECRVVRKLICPYLVTEFTASYGIRVFITVPTQKPITCPGKSNPRLSILFLKSILILCSSLRLGFQSDHLAVVFFSQNAVWIFLLPGTWHILFLWHPSWLGHPISITCGEQVSVLILVQFYIALWYCLSLGPHVFLSNLLSNFQEYLLSDYVQEVPWKWGNSMDR
jgi:hypothetical protein